MHEEYSVHSLSHKQTMGIPNDDTRQRQGMICRFPASPLDLIRHPAGKQRSGKLLKFGGERVARLVRSPFTPIVFGLRLYMCVCEFAALNLF